jgi:hypothetical protein
MKVMLGIAWERPSHEGYVSVVAITAATVMLAFVMVPLMGGSLRHVVGFGAIALVSTWLSASGARYDRAGMRGMVVSTTAGAFAWVAAMAACVTLGL